VCTCLSMHVLQACGAAQVALASVRSTSCTQALLGTVSSSSSSNSSSSFSLLSTVGDCLSTYLVLLCACCTNNCACLLHCGCKLLVVPTACGSSVAWHV
jgi:hypothetical protein